MKRLWNGAGFPLICFAVALVLIFTGYAIDASYGDPALSVTLLFWMMGMLPIAVSLYRMRRRDRLVYGLIELVAACALFYATMLAIIQRGDAAPMSFETIATRMITFLALVYFMVRALDNIGEGLKPWPRVEARWDKVFPKT